MLKSFQDMMLLARNDPAAYQAYCREKTRQLKNHHDKLIVKETHAQLELHKQLMREEQQLRANIRAQKADMRRQNEKLKEEHTEKMYNELHDTIRRLLARTEAVDITLAALLVEVRAARIEARNVDIQEQTHRQSLKDGVVEVVDVLRQELKAALTSTLVDEEWDACNEVKK